VRPRMRLAHVLTAGSLALAGCQHFDRGRECRTLADDVNPELRELATEYGQRTPISASAYRDASSKYHAAAVRLGQQQFKDSEIAHLAQDLRDNLVAISKTCDRLAAHFDRPALDPSARHDMENARQRHASLVSAIDKLCQE
jgi:hypothetical protein